MQSSWVTWPTTLAMAVPVPADSVRGVSLIADGRQELDKGILVGDKKVNGVGAEIALNPVSGLIQGIVPGATMRTHGLTGSAV